jgi:deoxyribodipyrimidine photo-lyase
VKALIWFRRDLRLRDNPALAAALASGLPVEAIYVHVQDHEDPASMGAASRWYLHHSLVELQQGLARIGVPLRLLVGSSETLLPAFCAEHAVSQVYWNRVVEPLREANDERLKSLLSRVGIDCRVFPDDCLLMPEQGCKADGSAYRVFTPFWRSLQNRLHIPDLQLRMHPMPRASAEPVACSPTAVDALQLLPRHPWQLKLHHHWQPGEASAQRLLESFVENKLAHYEVQRDLPAVDGTSRLSPALHFGEISVAQVYVYCSEVLMHEPDEAVRSATRRFLSEIGWREFGRHVLHAFPHTSEHSMKRLFDQDGIWEPDPDERLLHAWQRGETGIALVDAGMRELWETGWMQNRVRMIAGSFLTKNLGIHWREGARWFRDTLVDADLASNTLGWQWVAGCGTDAAPYFRIFNPDTQASKFDAEGHYIARWLDDRMRRPPIVDLKLSRARALQRYKRAIRQNVG